MGLPKFFSLVIKKFYSSCITNKQQIRNSHSLCFDLNSVLHTLAGKFFGYTEDEKERKRIINLLSRNDHKINWTNYCNLVIAYLKMICNQYLPHTVSINIDGVPPLAKVVQQRSRRYLVKPYELFDSNSITPYTDFMNFIDDKLSSLIKDIFADEIIYSGSNIADEGEQKIFSFIRLNVIDSKKPILIFGLDADLILMSLLSNSESIFLIRDVDKGDYTYSVIINIADLKTRINMETGNINGRFDFCLMVLLFGSDFYPSVPGITYFDIWETIFDIYKKENFNLIKGYEIDLRELERFLSSLPYEGENGLLNFHVKKTHTNDTTSYLASIKYENYRNEYYAFISASSENVFDMCGNWIEMLNWTYSYFKFGSKAVGNKVYYRYPIAPLIPDIISFLRVTNKIELNIIKEKLNPYAILLDVIPDTSRAVYTNKLDFITDSRKKIIPIIDEYIPPTKRIIVLPNLEYENNLKKIKRVFENESDESEESIFKIKEGSVINYSFKRGLTISRETVRLLSSKKNEKNKIKKEIPIEKVDIFIPKQKTVYVGKLYL